MPGSALGGRLLRRLARGRALRGADGRMPRGAATGHRGEGWPAAPMTALCALDQCGFLDRCRSARGGSEVPGLGSDPPGRWQSSAGAM